MTDWKPGMDQCEQHLIVLRDELAGRGVRCVLDDRGLWPRLRIYCPDEGATAEFDNNVVAAPLSGRWYFCWPSAVPIGSVTRVARAAGYIITDLGILGTEGDGTAQAVACLAVSRMPRQTRLGTPGGAMGLLSAGQETARPTAQLTEREMHVLDAICDPGAAQQAPGGAPAARQIAAGLSVAEATVRQHLLHLYRKLDVQPGPERRARLASKAVALGLAPPGAPSPASLTAPHPEPG